FIIVEIFLVTTLTLSIWRSVPLGRIIEESASSQDRKKLPAPSKFEIAKLLVNMFGADAAFLIKTSWAIGSGSKQQTLELSAETANANSPMFAPMSKTISPFSI